MVVFVRPAVFWMCIGASWSEKGVAFPSSSFVVRYSRFSVRLVVPSYVWLVGLGEGGSIPIPSLS